MTCWKLSASLNDFVVLLNYSRKRYINYIPMGFYITNIIILSTGTLAHLVGKAVLFVGFFLLISFSFEALLLIEELLINYTKCSVLRTINWLLVGFYSHNWCAFFSRMYCERTFVEKNALIRVHSSDESKTCKEIDGNSTVET